VTALDEVGVHATGRPSGTILELAHATRVHGHGATEVRALCDVSLQVGPGELVAVMGPSGSGKSTLLTLAGGLDTPTSGEVYVEGRALSTLSAGELARLRRRSLGYVFQDLNLVPALTAAENVMLPLELDGERQGAARRAAVEALGEVELADLADRFPDEMSGGQQQRVAIARALVGPRRLVLADEPTGALDSETGEAVLRVLRARVDAGAAGLLVTHEARHAAWADRVVFLRDGVVVDTTGAPRRVEQLLDETGPRGGR
jgi:putative ABC transport system ATP-binding protein